MKIHYNIILFSALSLCVSLLGCTEYAGSSSLAAKIRSENSLKQKSEKEKKKPHIEFFEDYALACENARKEEKPIMLFFYLPTCVYCQQMQEDTFTDEEVVRLSQQFVCIKIDVSREEKLREEYNVDVMPTVQFMNSQGILLQRISAKKTPNQILVQMQVAIESLAARTRMTNR